MGFSLPGSAGPPARILPQHGLTMESQPSFGIYLLCCGLLHGLHVDLCSSMGCRGIPALAPPALTRVSAGLFLSYNLTPFFHGRIYFCAITLFSLNRLSQQHSYHLMCLVVAGWLALELSAMGKLFKKAILVAHHTLLPKHCYTNPSGKDQAVLLYVTGTGR